MIDAERPEPGHPVHPGRRCRDRLRPAAGLAVQGGTARLREQGRARCGSPGAASIEPIAASAATVIMGLLCLLLSRARQHQGPRPGRRHRHRGRPGRLDDLPARRPARLRPADLLADRSRASTTCTPRTQSAAAGLWGRVSGLVGRSPRKVWVVTALGLLACAAFLPTFKAERHHPGGPVPQRGRVRHRRRRCSPQHFPAGSGTPGADPRPRRSRRRPVVRIATGVEGVAGASASPVPGTPPKVVDGQVLVQATLEPAADSPEADEGGQAPPRRSSTASAPTSWSAATRRSTSTSSTPATATCG